MAKNFLFLKIKIEFDKANQKFGRICGFLMMPIILVGRFMEKLYILYIKSCVPINNNLIIFKSKPDFSDNSRAMAEFMINNGYLGKYTICFDVVDKSIAKKFKHLPITFFSSSNDYGLKKFKDLKFLYTAKLLLSTHEMVLPINNKRNGQQLIRLWHGCGYKDRASNDNVETRRFDLALVPGEVFIKTKAYFWNVDEKYILAKGYPRYDWLLKKDECAIQLSKKIIADHSSKMIIWMPTYRVDKYGRINDTNKLDMFPIVHTSEEWETLDLLCFDNHITLFVKLHPYQLDYDIPFDKFRNIKNLTNDILDVDDIPLYKFVALCDGLISDYSSIAIDYLLVDRPIAFTLDDYDLYKESRGFVFENPLEYMPGHHLYNFNDLTAYIESVANGEDPFKKERDKIRKVTVVQSDHYCLDILDTLDVKI